MYGYSSASRANLVKIACPVDAQKIVLTEIVNNSSGT